MSEHTAKVVSITGIAAPTALAEFIEFGSKSETMRLSDGTSECTVRGDSDYTELRFTDAASITIRRADNFYTENQPATVSWSSSSSNNEGTAAAAATIKALTFAVAVADQLNKWMAAGQLPRLNG